MPNLVELLARHHATLESALYAAEQICHEASGGRFRFCPADCKLYKTCPFCGMENHLPYTAIGTSKIFLIRNIIGEPVRQEHVDQNAYTGPCPHEKPEEGSKKVRCGKTTHKPCPDAWIDGDSGIRYCGRKWS